MSVFGGRGGADEAKELGDLELLYARALVEPFRSVRGNLFFSGVVRVVALEKRRRDVKL